MRKAHMNTVRIAEFAWSSIEAEEGQFTLDWIERAIDAATRHDLKVVLGTPTAAPPPWLTQRYPDVLAVGPSGIRRRPGSRCEYAPANATYTRLAVGVANAMAMRFGQHPSVIGWQVDNEYKSISHDDDTRAQFHHWLSDKYGSLDELNRRWCGAYWSQTYSDWAQIPLPVRSADIFPDEHYHPALLLDWRRFQGVVYRRFQAAQIAAIRAHADPRQWITHNFMGFFDAFDHYEVSADLDFVSWDSYVPNARPDPFANGASHDLMRGLKRRNFWLMETQPGFVNWRSANNTLDPGEIRTMAWHAIGHGADAVAYWQWRSALNSQELYHGTMLAADGQPRPFFGEVALLGEELSRLAPTLEGTVPNACVGLLHGYDSRWAIDFQRHHHAFDPVLQMVEWYRPLRELGHDVEIVEPYASLDSFDLVLAPSLHVVDAKIVDSLTAFVERGGHLVLGPRSGIKDVDNALFPMRGPGPLTEIAPGRVEEFYVLEESVAVEGALGAGRARIWADWLEPRSPDAQSLLTYRSPMSWFDGKCAALTHSFGAGRVTLLGSWFDHATLLRLTRTIAATSKLRHQPLLGPDYVLPEGIEICRRVRAAATLDANGTRDSVYVAINHGRERRELQLPSHVVDLLTGSAHETLVLEPLSVRVFRMGGAIVE